MINRTLAESYLLMAVKRLKVLPLLLQEEAYAVVVREAQELVELALKGVLRQAGVEPPKQHDVGGLLLEFKSRLPREVAKEVKRLAEISKWLRKEREFSFYGDVDFIPTEEYHREDAERALRDAEFTVRMATLAIEPDHTQ